MSTKKKVKLKKDIKVVAAPSLRSQCFRADAKPKRVNRGKIIQPHHIEAVKKFLPRGKDHAITMASLAKLMQCSKGAAERRFNAYLKQYKGLDQKVKFIPVREGERGPMSAGFYL